MSAAYGLAIAMAIRAGSTSVLSPHGVDLIFDSFYAGAPLLP